MSVYMSIKQKFIKPIISWRNKLLRFNMAANAKNQAREFIRRFNFDKLSKEEIYSAKTYWKSKGFKLDNTLWHQYYKGASGIFKKEFLPHDIFCSRIAPLLNQKTQWPALLDKNLAYSLFKEFEHPELLVSNINGFYFHEGDVITESQAIDFCSKSKNKLIIKPSIESGGGFMVKVITVKDDSKETKRELSELFNIYAKDFVVQKFVEQSETLAQLNDSSLNTMRIMSYLNGQGVHIISSVLRVGNIGSNTDNFKTGGIACGIEETGQLKETGFFQNGETVNASHSGFVFKDVIIPNYDVVIKIISALHKRVPYFKIISWDIGMNKYDQPVLIEYNTYNQSTKIHQIVNGPLFGAFTDEILSLALD